MLALLLAVSACADERPVDLEAALWGSWVLDAIEIDGEPFPITVGATTAGIPWLEIDGSMWGSLGCNHLQSEDVIVVDGRLIPGDVIRTAALCTGPDGTDVMAVEEIITGVLTRSDGPRLTLDGEEDGRTMTWTEGATRLVFVPGTPPVPEPPEPPSSLGPLDCSPGVVAEQRLGDVGGDPPQILRDLVPGVVEVVAGEPLWWWGYDGGGTVIAAIARGDIEPVQYQVFSCDR